MKSIGYSAIRNYKKFKKEYPYFMLFIKCGEYYYTFDSDARIMMYLYDSPSKEMDFRIEKREFEAVLFTLHAQGLNVVLAGSKITKEYYSSKMNNYMKMKKKGKDYFNATKCSVSETNI